MAPAGIHLVPPSAGRDAEFDLRFQRPVACIEAATRLEPHREHAAGVGVGESVRNMDLRRHARCGDMRVDEAAAGRRASRIHPEHRRGGAHAGRRDATRSATFAPLLECRPGPRPHRHRPEASHRVGRKYTVAAREHAVRVAAERGPGIGRHVQLAAERRHPRAATGAVHAIAAAVVAMSSRQPSVYPRRAARRSSTMRCVSCVAMAAIDGRTEYAGSSGNNTGAPARRCAGTSRSWPRLRRRSTRTGCRRAGRCRCVPAPRRKRPLPRRRSARRRCGSKQATSPASRRTRTRHPSCRLRRLRRRDCRPSSTTAKRSRASARRAQPRNRRRWRSTPHSRESPRRCARRR